MASRQFTQSNLERILRESAGEGDVDGDTAVVDTCFSDLGYDSVALLETAGRIEREFGITLDDSVLIGTLTPRELIGQVNEQLRTVGD